MSYRWISERGKGGGRKGEAISGNVEAAKPGGEIFRQVKGGSFYQFTAAGGGHLLSIYL